MESEHPGSGTFAILRSVLSAEALSRVVEEEYGLPGARCELIKAVVLDTYRVDASGGPFVLRVYPHGHRSLEEILGELEFLDHLSASGLSVSASIPRQNGERTISIAAPEGERHAALFTYARGRPLEEVFEPGAEPATAVEFGRLIARLHLAADGLDHPLSRPALDVEALIDRPLSVLQSAMAAWPGELNTVRGASAELRLLIAALPLGRPWYGLCHGDAVAANAHIDDQGRITFFDFDFCGPSWRAYDIAVATGDVVPKVARAIVDGYDEVRPLEPGEVEAVPLFRAARAIWVLAGRASHLNEWGNVHFSERQIRRGIETIERSMRELVPGG